MVTDIEESNKDYTEIINHVKEKGLSTEEWVKTPDVAESSQVNSGYKVNTWRYQLVPGILDYLHKNDVVEREERHEGGKATHYWRLKE